LLFNLCPEKNLNTSPLKLKILGHKNATLEIPGIVINLIIAKSISRKATGLLNHLSLPISEGLVLPRTTIIHTFGMHFPIIAMGFDKHGNQIGVSKLILPNNIAKLPFRARFTVEISAQHKGTVNALPVASLPQFLCAVLGFLLRA